ncbi:hypothetical protein R1sor_006353 [Riccia sorocarpa]|uniref:Reverse transcriptase domain-containing protein n=1 Tax=Riccia sorocarpa TaxID=122646 RepID=A0ABD3HMD4_9MARC
MVQCFWRKKKLLPKDKRGIIKLIPKDGDLLLIKSWRPISLLSITYKIIARVIAFRLKHMLPGIIDSQQTGFIAGRTIVDNVLSLRLAQEWALATHQDVLFVKLDFQKAYDRVAHKSLLHQLYADDTGINIATDEQQFGRLQEVIQQFERCSGAKLNLSKSLIMPLAPTVIPDWVVDTGCQIAKPGVHFKYLGVLAGCPVDERAIAQAVIKKVQNKLSHWSNRLLSWPARTLLLKHVLAATPLYQLLSVGLSPDGIEDLERLCKQFLWGWNEQGNAKKTLVAWERVSQTKRNGGLGWIPFKDRAKAMHIKLLTSLLHDGGSEWTQLAKNLSSERYETDVTKGSVDRDR